MNSSSYECGRIHGQFQGCEDEIVKICSQKYRKWTYCTKVKVGPALYWGQNLYEVTAGCHMIHNVYVVYLCMFLKGYPTCHFLTCRVLTIKYIIRHIKIKPVHVCGHLLLTHIFMWHIYNDKLVETHVTTPWAPILKFDIYLTPIKIQVMSTYHRSRSLAHGR